jgi:hypothetical protein
LLITAAGAAVLSVQLGQFTCPSFFFTCPNRLQP